MKITGLTIVLALLVLLPQAGFAQKEVQSRTKGTLEVNTALLNMWGDQPDAINEMYKTAYNVLAEDPKNTYAEVSENKEVQEIWKENGRVHFGGPILGNVSSEGASLWIRTLGPAKVKVLVNINGKEKVFGPVKSSPATDMTSIVWIDGLEPGTRYSYSVLVNGKEIDLPDNASLNTLPEKEEVSGFRIAFGTCFHRWGLGNMKQSEAIRNRQPGAMLLGGDIGVQDRLNNTAMHRADYLMRDFFPAWQHLVAEIPVYATWDDHDYFDNDLAGIPEGFTRADKDAVREVFMNAWNNPSTGFEKKGEGIFFRTRIGPADVIMLDHRYFRTGEPGSFLGEEQMKWLEEQLLDCKGPFIILSNGTMWSDYVSRGKDSWGVNDPEGRERIFKLIEENHISGVLLISGDRHGARGFTIPRPSGFEFYEFEAGSLGGRTGPSPTKPEWDTQFYGISGRYAFGEFEFDTSIPDPTVTFRLIGDDGSFIHELKLTRSQLTPK